VKENETSCTPWSRKRARGPQQGEQVKAGYLGPQRARGIARKIQIRKPAKEDYFLLEFKKSRRKGTYGTKVFQQPCGNAHPSRYTGRSRRGGRKRHRPSGFQRCRSETARHPKCQERKEGPTPRESLRKGGRNEGVTLIKKPNQGDSAFGTVKEGNGTLEGVENRF